MAEGYNSQLISSLLSGGSGGGKPGALFGVIQDVQLVGLSMPSPKIFDSQVVRSSIKPLSGGILSRILADMGITAQNLQDGFKQVGQGGDSVLSQAAAAGAQMLAAGVERASAGIGSGNGLGGVGRSSGSMIDI